MRALDRAVDEAAVKVTSGVLHDDPALALVRLGSEAGAVVVGNRGHGELAEMLLGSVSLSVAAHAESPVIVVRGYEEAIARDHRSVVGVGDPREAAPAVDFAFREAHLLGASVTVVHAWRCPAREVPDFPTTLPDEHQQRSEARLDECARDARAAHPDIPVHRRTVEGHARTALLAASRTADLLVVGARRRNGRVGLRLGPVDHAVLHHAACPVGIVPHS
ncbi:universal stress protein [Streptomyces atriruber]|uniref:universal stress protein n=1 Tax=Streptomyces atriruber TaxID=545121 RepID=UPI0006E4154B|nr:universal stress protein [Streptomyces atriruber]